MFPTATTISGSTVRYFAELLQEEKREAICGRHAYEDLVRPDWGEWRSNRRRPGDPLPSFFAPESEASYSPVTGKVPREHNHVSHTEHPLPSISASLSLRYTQKGSYRRRATCLDATCVCADVLEFEPLYGDKPEKSDTRTRSKGSYLGIVHAFVLPMHTLCSFLSI